jgi:predicted nicotinamide N-methyase
MQMITEEVQVVIAGKSIHVLVPEQDYIRQQYREGQIDFPYWGKIWPASIALCNFIYHKPGVIQNKVILELGAGLGLPSLYSASFAKQVYCSDYNQEAVELARKSAELNAITNLQSLVIDWKQVPPEIEYEVVLLSDVNYAQEQFDALYELICSFMERKVTVLLSTPQRLPAKPFIDRLVPFIQQQDFLEVNETAVSIFQLQHAD